MKKFCYIAVILIGLLGKDNLEAGYTFKDGKIVNTKLIATMPAEDHYQLGINALNQGNWKDATEQFLIVTTNFADTPLGQEAFYYLGVSDYFLEELDSANEAFTEYLKAQNNPQYFEETMRFKHAIAYELKNGAKVRFFGSKHFPKWASGQELAVQVFDEVIMALPCHELTALSLYYKGEILREQRWYRESIDVFFQLIRRFPKHELAPESYVMITSIYLEQSQQEFQNPDLIALAEIALRRFKDDFPRSELVSIADANVKQMKEVYAEGLFAIGQFYERKKETRASIIYYQNAVLQFPDTAISRLCKERLSVLGTVHLD